MRIRPTTRTSLIALRPRQYGGQLAMVPPPGGEARLGGDDSLAIGTDDWWGRPPRVARGRVQVVASSNVVRLDLRFVAVECQVPRIP